VFIKLLLDKRPLFDGISIGKPLLCVNQYLNTNEDATRSKNIRLAKISKNRNAPLKEEIGSENNLIKYTINCNVILVSGTG